MIDSLDFYNQNAGRYAAVNHGSTDASVDLRAFIERLEPLIVPNRPLRVLDAGSGTGRDTLAMLALGFEVDAFDGSVAMAEQSTLLTGQTTRVMRFEALDLPAEHYDGIWAMASLLHVQRADLPQALIDLGGSLREGGVLFASFKYGTGERVDARDGRAFTDLDEDGVAQLLGGMTGWELMETTLRQPPAHQTNQEPWFSFTVRRVGPVLACEPGRKINSPRAKPFGA